MLECLKNNVDVKIHCLMSKLSVCLLINGNEYAILFSFDYICYFWNIN